MAEEGFRRKLTAILSADVEGYSRLMGEDEDATIRTLTAYRELMSTLIQKQHGRVVDSPGDNLLAEFLSVVDAVRCAVEIQEELRVRNAELPDGRRMEFRIGINLGDVVEEGERIYGDGVNITARVEGLAEGGGICISGTVYDSIKSKLSLGYESLGEHTVKNIKEPVRVYRMRVGPDASALEESKEKKPAVKRWQWAAMAAMVVLILGGVAVWNFYFRLPSVEPASVEKMAFQLPDKPSIAVLPFENMSGDPKQEYFSDGITEGIITALAKLPSMFVIARNSTFTYKGKPVKVQKIAEDLGVRYVLEGSLQKSGDRVRISAQLIDAINGKHLWAEKYDRDRKDLFGLQDEITMKIITALRVELTDGEGARLYAKGTNNIEAYIKGYQGYGDFLKFSKEGNVKARQLFHETIALDPEYPHGYSGLGWTHMMDARWGWSESRRESMEKALEMAQKANAVDKNHIAGSRLLSYIYRQKRQYEKSMAEIEKWIEFEPNNTGAYLGLASVLYALGRGEETIASAKKAIRLDPISSGNSYYYLGMGYWVMGQYEEAIAAYKKALYYRPTSEAYYTVLTATYSLLDREEEARTAAAEVFKLNPKFSVDRIAKRLPFKNKAYTERYVNALRKAGLN